MRNPRKGRDQILQCSIAEPWSLQPEGPNKYDLKIRLSPSGNHEHLREGTAALMMRMVLCGEVRVRFRLAVGAAQLRGDSVDGVVLVDLRRLVSQFRAPHSII